MLRINIKTLIQYFFCYLMLLDVGNDALPSIKMGTEIFYMTALVIGMYYLILKHNRDTVRYCLKKDFKLFLMGLCAMLLFICIVSFGGVRYSVIICMIARIVIVFAAVAVKPEEFVTNFIRLVCVLAVISDVIFIGYYFGGPSVWTAITSHLPRIYRHDLSVGDQYGYFVLCFNYFHITRNSYIFGEPGEYQLVLSTAIYLLYFFKSRFAVKEQVCKFVILFVTMLTTQSTTGICNLIVISICILINKNTDKNKIIIKKTLIITLFIIIGYFIVSDVGVEYVEKVLTSKLINTSGELDLSENTGAARWSGFIRLGQYALANPSGFILGIGTTARIASGVTSCNGFTNSILDFGLITMLWISGSFFWCIYKYSNHNSYAVFSGSFIILNTWFSQPNPLYTLMVLIGFIHMFLYNKYGMEENTNECEGVYV